MSRQGTLRRNRALREIGEMDATEGKSIDAFYELKGIDHTENNRAVYEIGYRAAKSTLRKHDDETITAVLEVIGRERFCVTQQVRIVDGVARQAAIKKVREAVAKRYETNVEAIVFHFWTAAVRTPLDTVVVQLDNTGTPSINTFASARS